MGASRPKRGLRSIWERLPRFLEVIVTAVLASGVSGYVGYTLTSQDSQPDITRVFGISVESFDQYPPEWRSLIALAATTPSKFSNKAQRVIREATPEQADAITKLTAFVIGGQLLFRREEDPTHDTIPWSVCLSTYGIGIARSRYWRRQRGPFRSSEFDHGQVQSRTNCAKYDGVSKEYGSSESWAIRGNAIDRSRSGSRR